MTSNQSISSPYNSTTYTMENQVKKYSALEKFIISLQAPTLKEKVNFLRLLSVAQKAWLWLREALISIKKSESNIRLKAIMEDLISQLTQWSNFAKAMENHDYFFKADEIALIRSAETMWNMPDVLEEISQELENYQQIIQKVKKAITYPAVLIVFAIIAVVILLIFVMPTITGMFPPEEKLPSITLFMIWASDIIRNTWFLIISWMIGIYFLYNFLYNYILPFKILIDWMMLKIPIISWVVKTFYMYRFSKLLWQFYWAWVSPVMSLKLIADIFDNFYYKRKCINIKDDLSLWFTFAESMEWSNLFDPILIQIIHVWEETWNIWGILNKMSDFYRETLKTKIDILMSLLEPLLMAVIAIVIGLMVWAIFIPMADLVNVIK